MKKTDTKDKATQKKGRQWNKETKQQVWQWNRKPKGTNLLGTERDSKLSWWGFLQELMTLILLDLLTAHITRILSSSSCNLFHSQDIRAGEKMSNSLLCRIIARLFFIYPWSENPTSHHHHRKYCHHTWSHLPQHNLLTIGVVKAVLLTVVRKFSPEKLEHSRQTCLIKLEDPSIQYSSQEPEYLYPGYQDDIYKYGPHGDGYEEETCVLCVW